MTELVAIVQKTEDTDARKIASFVQIASQFSSDIHLCWDEVCADAKSIMGMMTFSLIQGEEVRIQAEGEDAKDAAETIKKILEGKR